MCSLIEQMLSMKLKMGSYQLSHLERLLFRDRFFSNFEGSISNLISSIGTDFCDSLELSFGFCDWFSETELIEYERDKLGSEETNEGTLDESSHDLLSSSALFIFNVDDKVLGSSSVEKI